MLRRLFRHVVAPTVLTAGGGRLLRILSGRSALNVMYHGVVSSDSTWFSPRHLTKVEFDKQLSYLTQRFDVISSEEMFRQRKGKERLNRPTISLSFDDGYLNNLEVALPIIEKYRVPVTFFVLGTCAVDGEPRVAWPDLIAVLGRMDVGQFRLGSEQYAGTKNIRTGTSLSDDLKRMSAAGRDEALAELDARFSLSRELEHVPSEIWKLMDPGELKRLSESRYVEIGSHAYGHYNLGLISPADALADMKRSKEVLEALLDRPVQSIAFPDGSYSQVVKDLAMSLGFKRQLAVTFSGVDDPTDQRIQARFGVSCTTTTASAMLHLNRAFAVTGML